MGDIVVTRPAQLLPISMLTIEPSATKDLDKEHEIKLRRSIETYGQLRNILVDNNLRVVEGSNVVRIMREIGYEYVEVKLAPPGDVLPQLNLGSEYSTFNFVKLSVLLSQHFDLTNKGVLFDKLPFANDDIEDYIESTVFSLAQFNAHKRPQQATLFAPEAAPDTLTDGLFSIDTPPPAPDEPQMRALSWKEPFATLMLRGKIETRRWDTDYRGPVLICATLTPYKEKDVLELCGQPQLARILAAVGDNWKTGYLGQAIAIGDLVDVRNMREEDADACYVKFDPLLFCHVYENVRLIQPMPFKGAQQWTILKPEFVDTINMIDDGVEN